MRLKNNKNAKKTDLLELSDADKIKLLKTIRENLQQKALEAKLWHSFAESENLTINGANINPNSIKLKGLFLTDNLNI